MNYGIPLSTKTVGLFQSIYAEGGQCQQKQVQIAGSKCIAQESF